MCYLSWGIELGAWCLLMSCRVCLLPKEFCACGMDGSWGSGPPARWQRGWYGPFSARIVRCRVGCEGEFGWFLCHLAIKTHSICTVLWESLGLISLGSCRLLAVCDVVEEPVPCTLASDCTGLKGKRSGRGLRVDLESRCGGGVCPVDGLGFSFSFIQPTGVA